MPRRVVVTLLFLLPASLRADPLPGTKPLETKKGEDLARTMVDGIHHYLDRATAASIVERKAHWKLDASSVAAYEKSIQPNRERLQKILGVVDARATPSLSYVWTSEAPAFRGKTSTFEVWSVRWSVLPGIDAEGLLLQPTAGKGKEKANVIAIPDADIDPEVIAGLVAKPGPGQFARLLAEQGCRVLIPTLINRDDELSANPKIKRATNQTHREFVYRMSYEMGRHVLGYEIQRVLAAVDWFARDKDHAPIGVYGFGEGGVLALYAGALDPRISTTCVSGYFGPRENLHEEPIYHNVWRLLTEFGDAELMQLIAPRALVIEHVSAKLRAAPPPREGRGGAAPGEARTPDLKAAQAEFARGLALLPPAGKLPRKEMVFLPPPASAKPVPPTPGSPQAVDAFLSALTIKSVPAKEEAVEILDPPAPMAPKPGDRHKRQFDQLVAYTQALLPQATPTRQSFFWSRFDMKSAESLKKSQEPLRQRFHEEIIGKLPAPTMPLNPRTRKILETPKWTGYEVVLDVYDDVIAFGILLVPNNIKPGEKRPVVVCQHGLEGRPMDVVDPSKKTPYYHSFGAQLADIGFVVFAPQNPYIFETHFRQIVRKANPLGLSLYSFIVVQHQRIIEFLRTLGFVDPERIAFYGLSYGGKVAMRIPSILLEYCLSICSGDFNEWIWKNITLDWGSSYMFTREYDMYEFNLGNTFNYAEMAALIAPRPFMVERGHADGVGLDEFVAFEYAKVRRFYAGLGLPERTRIEFFVGGHIINGQETFDFLKRHLKFEGK